jgi:hypothetical protein
LTKLSIKEKGGAVWLKGIPLVNWTIFIFFSSMLKIHLFLKFLTKKWGKNKRVLSHIGFLTHNMDLTMGIVLEANRGKKDVSLFVLMHG